MGIKGARAFAKITTLRPNGHLNSNSKQAVLVPCNWFATANEHLWQKKELFLQELLGEIPNFLCTKPNQMIIVVHSSPALFCSREWVLNLSRTIFLKLEKALRFCSPGISLKEELTVPMLILGVFSSSFFFFTSSAFLFHGCHLHPEFFPLWDSVWKLGVFPAPWAAELWGV